MDVNRQKIEAFEGRKHLMFYPDGFGTEYPNTRFPLMLFLHGRGESGSNIQDVAKTGLPEILERQPFPFKEFPFVVISPQCPWSAYWTADSQMVYCKNLVDHYIKQLGPSIDPQQVYLTGLSMGGFGAFEIAAEYPGMWAAVVPICGGVSSSRRSEVQRIAKAVKDIPFWVFHGVLDDVVPIGCSDEIVDEMRRQGAREVQYTRYPDLQHDSWTRTYENPEVYEWLLKHSKVK